MLAVSDLTVLQRGPTPLYLQIEQIIRDQLNSGELQPNDRVSSETELSERLGVSRMTARKAVDNLVSEGLLFRRPGMGTYVAPPRIAHGLSTQLSFSAGMEKLGLEHETEVLRAALVRAPHRAARSLGLSDGAPIVTIERLRIVEGEPVALHHADLPGEFAAILDADLTGSLTKAMEDVGASVASARDTVDAVLAESEAADRLQVSTGDPLVHLEGVAYSTGRRPMRYTNAFYRTDRFLFSIDSESTDLTIEFRTGPDGQPEEMVNKPEV